MTTRLPKLFAWIPALALALCIMVPVTYGQTIVLYENDFESPNVPVSVTCGLNLNQININTVYGSSQGTFAQILTVETVIINVPGYSDPAGTGGNYAIGMLRSVNNDRLALAFDAQGKDFINVGLDISTIWPGGCGVPESPGASTFRITLRDSPSGTPDFGGTILDQVDITGTAGPDTQTYNWTNHVVALDASGSTNSNVTVVWDLIGQTEYGVFDNLIIAASDTPGDTGDNAPPDADAGGPYSGDEGAAISLSGATADDDDADDLTYSWTVDSALCTFDDASALNPDLTCTDNGIFTATLSVDDGTNDPVTDDATVNVANVDPEVGAVTVPVEPIDVNDQPVTGVSAPYSDDGANDTHTCTVDYGDGTGAQAGTTDGSTCTGPDHTYAEAGVYEVTVEVTDDDDGTGSNTATTFIVIYDPDGGFVTGGGWIDSPAGACPVFCDDATGKANFGFVSKYKKGASVPTGQTEFNFKAGDLNFHSTSYDWLVIAVKKAMYKGDGRVNGEDDYSFQINAIDGDLQGGDGVDKFRIKIKAPGGGVIYDNQMGAGEDADPTTAIGGGQIKIHKSGGGNNLEAGETEVLDEGPAAYALEAAYPNPFNPQTTIRFDVPEAAEVQLGIYDVLGRQVRVLVDGQIPAGTHEMAFEAGGLPSGTYLVRLETPAGSFVQTMQLVK